MEMGLVCMNTKLCVLMKELKELKELDAGMPSACLLPQ